jgi:hypothetical protein
MRKGFTLVHMLLVLPLLTATMILWTEVFRMSVMDMPRIDRAYTTRRVAEEMLEQIHADARAASVVEMVAGGATGRHVLKLTIDDEPVTYRWGSEEEVTRTAGDAPTPAPGDVTTWTLPGGVLSLQVGEVRSAAVVEAEFFIRVRQADREVEAIRTRHLWFVGAGKEAGR